MRLVLGALALFVVSLGYSNSEAVVTRYTSPSPPNGTGAGSTCSQAAPCTNTTAVQASSAGDTIILEAGTATAPKIYFGENDMIRPVNRSGSQGAPITVRCPVPGGCLLDGNWVYIPVEILPGNDYWVIEDLNVKNGTNAMVLFRGSFNTARRIVAWDGDFSKGATAFACNNFDAGTGNVFEDVASFGVGSRTVGHAQALNGSCRFTRVWGRYEATSDGNNAAGAIGYLAYRSIGATCENCLGEYQSAGGPTTYQVPASSATVTASNRCTGVSSSNPIICTDGGPPIPGGNPIVLRWHTGCATPPACDGNYDTHILGGIFYAKSTANLAGVHLPAFNAISNSTIGLNGGTNVNTGGGLVFKDIINFLDTQHSQFSVMRGMSLFYRNTVYPLTASNVSSVAGQPDTIWTTGPVCTNTVHCNQVNYEPWTVANIIGATSLAGLNAQNANPWTGTAGGQVCFRYENRVLTTAKLWPWPMNQRIKDATGSQVLLQGSGRYVGPTSCPASGCVGAFPVRTEVDVTADIQALLGTIPAACRTDTAPTTFPDATGFSPATLSTF